jgi:phage shock protein E
MIRARLNSSILLFLLLFSTFAWSNEALWIDVRTADEYSQGHVAGAIHIPYEQIAGRIGEVTQDKDALIYLYCRSGRRSGIALDTLSDAGFTNTFNVGGLEDARRKAAENEGM